MLEINDIHIDAEVYFNDPDNDISSGYYKVTAIKGDIVTLDNRIECFIHELS